MRCTQAVLDTGAGPNLVHAKLLPEGWHHRLDPYKADTRIIDASNRPMQPLGIIPLWVRLGQFRARVRFIVVSNMATTCILGTSFIDRFVKAILPGMKKVVFYHSPAISIVGSQSPTTPNGSPRPLEDITNTVSNKIKVVKALKIPPMTRAAVTVQSPRGGLCFLQPSPKLATKQLSLMASGVMDVYPNKPFTIMVANFGHTTCRLPRNIIIGYAIDSPTAIYTPSGEALQKAGVLNQTKEGAGDEFIRTTSEVNAISQDESDTWEDKVHIGVQDGPVRKEVVKLLREFQPMWSGELGKIAATKHRIDLVGGAKPIYQQPYRAGPTAREHQRKEIDRMLQAGVIEPATSEWASPVVLVPKKDNTLGFCVDYRKLNAVTQRDSYPLPRMDECIDSLGDATIFTTLDCNSGYWQVEIDERDRNKTTCTSHGGLYRFVRMPFGLKNAPVTFQRAVDIILSRVKWYHALVYLDDVIIYSRSVGEHFNHVHEVLTLLREAVVSLKLTKCRFFESSVGYLGHVIRPGKLEIAHNNLKAIELAKPPDNQTELKSFLGMCNVYRRFVPNFARIAAPLNVKTSKKQPHHIGTLTDEEFESFRELKRMLMNPPVLALPQLGYKYTLDTDACDKQVGCTLLQDQPNGDRLPIGYWSRALTPAEKNYSTTERECLAVVWAILTLRPYLQGVKFTLRTDHGPLQCILNLADASGRLARWRLRLLEYEF